MSQEFVTKFYISIFIATPLSAFSALMYIYTGTWFPDVQAGRPFDTLEYSRSGLVGRLLDCPLC